MFAALTGVLASRNKGGATAQGPAVSVPVVVADTFNTFRRSIGIAVVPVGLDRSSNVALGTSLQVVSAPVIFSAPGFFGPTINVINAVGMSGSPSSAVSLNQQQVPVGISN